MTFARPDLVVVGLVVLLLLVVAYRTLENRRAAQSYAFSNLAFTLAALRPVRVPAALLFAAYVVGAGALLVALAGPRFNARIPTKDGSVVLCIDTSGSMRARDVAPTRAEAAREAARAFIDAVPSGTRVGIVSFSGGANVIAPPTSDLESVRDALARLPPPEGATAIGDALQLAAQQLPDRGRRIVVLLTDGVNNRGTDPLEASRTIGARGIAIETVGVGSSGSGETIPGTSEPAELDAQALTTIAENGRGRYVESSDAGTLRQIFRSIALATVWETKRIDGTTPFALGGGVILIVAFLGALAIGKF